MLDLSKKCNIVVKIEKLPTSILGVYLNVFDTPHILINEIVHPNNFEFIFLACLYYQKDGVGKITIEDMSDINNEAFIFARNNLKLNRIDCA